MIALNACMRVIGTPIQNEFKHVHVFVCHLSVDF